MGGVNVDQVARHRYNDRSGAAEGQPTFPPGHSPSHFGYRGHFPPKSWMCKCPRGSVKGEMSDTPLLSHPLAPVWSVPRRAADKTLSSYAARRRNWHAYKVGDAAGARGVVCGEYQHTLTIGAVISLSLWIDVNVSGPLTSTLRQPHTDACLPACLRYTIHSRWRRQSSCWLVHQNTAQFQLSSLSSSMSSSPYDDDDAFSASAPRLVQ